MAYIDKWARDWVCCGSWPRKIPPEEANLCGKKCKVPVEAAKWRYTFVHCKVQAPTEWAKSVRWALNQMPNTKSKSSWEMTCDDSVRSFERRGWNHKRPRLRRKQAKQKKRKEREREGKKKQINCVDSIQKHDPSGCPYMSKLDKRWTTRCANAIVWMLFAFQYYSMFVHWANWMHERCNKS